MSRVTGSKALSLWAAAWLALAFAIITGFSIGPLVMPFALVLLLVALVRARIWPEVLGGLIGIGALVLFVGVIQLPRTPCEPQGRSHRLAPGETYSCGRMPPAPWILAGLAFLAAGLVPLQIHQRYNRTTAQRSE